MPGNIGLGRGIRKRFGEYRQRGEWFYPADELVKYIEENRDPRIKKVIETIRDTGPGKKEAVAAIVDLDVPVKAGDCGAKLSRLPVMFPVGHPGDNYEYPTGWGINLNRGDHSQGGNDVRVSTSFC